MDDVLDEIVRVARRCERTAHQFDDSLLRRIHDAINEVESAWCGSWLGQHGTIYMENLRPVGRGEFFDSEWGNDYGPWNRTRGNWCHYTYEVVEEAILLRAGVESLEAIREVAKEAGDAFEQSRDELLPTFDALLAAQDDSVLKGLRSRLATMPSHMSWQDFVERERPKNFFTRDSAALAQTLQGLRVPHHIRLRTQLFQLQSHGIQVQEVAKIARHAERYLKHKMQMKGRTVARTDGKIFIGHGRSNAWRDLKDFIQDRLQLPWDEFNREPTAGMTAKERLENMLDEASFAFLVMTAEDEHADSSKHARENVIHEIGLFQGRFGFNRAIILLEHGCAEFSNVAGVQQIRFSPGNIREVYEEIRRVLEREGILK